MQPEWRFDFGAATCRLTLHFLEKDERRRTAAEIDRRLKLQAPFVIAHDDDRITAMKERLPVPSPDEDEEILRDSGTSVDLFYAAFTFKEWVCYKP